MSLPLTTWAWSLELPVTEKLLLLALADCCHAKQRSHSCWPSHAKLEAMTGFSRSTLKRALRRLEQRALIKRSPGQGRRTSTYRLACSDGPNHCLDLDDPLAPKARRARAAARSGATPDPAAGPPATPPEAASGVRAVTPQRGQPEPGRGHSSDPRNGKRTGKEREAQSRAGAARASPPPSRAARALTQQPPVAWLAIAEQVRPDLRDPRQVFDKFAAYQGEAAYTPAQWEQRWRLWLSREREPGAPSAATRPGAAARAERAWGSFLEPPAARRPGGDDLTADFEVIRHDQP
jgi:hypothetical protein